LLFPSILARLREQRVWVTTQVETRHIRASVAAQTLRPFFASAGSIGLEIGTSGNERTVLLRGLAADVAKAAEIIADSDQPASLPKVDEDRVASLEARVRVLEAKVSELSERKAEAAGAEKKKKE